MDTYFQSVHGLPSEIGRIIMLFASLSHEISNVQLKGPEPRNPWQVAFFTEWEEVHGLMQALNTNTLIYIRPNGAHMYISW